MYYYGFRTESEILSGCILKMSKSFDRKKDLETILLGVRSLRKQAKAWVNGNGSGSEDRADDDSHLYRKASAWYHVTYHPKFWGRYNDGLDHGHFLSFPWHAWDKLLEIKRKKVGNLKAASSSSDHSSSLAPLFNKWLSLY